MPEGWILDFLAQGGPVAGFGVVAWFLYSGYQKLFSTAEESHEKRITRIEGEFARYRERAETERERLLVRVDELERVIELLRQANVAQQLDLAAKEAELISLRPRIVGGP